MAAIATPQERRELGRARRKQVPRAQLAEWSAKHRKSSALDVLKQSERGRVASLLVIKHQRMAASPFGYFRGAVPVMAADLSLLPNSAIQVQICGDAHVRNLGAFASPDGRLLFDINDFDETTRAPFEFDTRRMAVSLVLAGRQSSHKKSACSEAVSAFLTRYARTVRQLSELPVLEMARWQVHRLQRIQPVSEALLQAERATPLRTLDQLTRARGAGREFREEPPLLVRMKGAVRGQILRSLEQYRESLLPERRHFLDQYTPRDVALKVVGTGSVGTRCYVIYLEGNGAADPLFLQFKEETHSAWSPYLQRTAGGEPQHMGRRVAEGQRAMQFQSDPMLGWTTIGSRDYVVRQLNDHKGSIADAAMEGDGLRQYAEVCGEVLARGHCRSGDPCVLSGYVGNGSKLAQALEHFAQRYADQTEKDWLQMCTAFKLKPGGAA